MQNQSIDIQGDENVEHPNDRLGINPTPAVGIARTGKPPRRCQEEQRTQNVKTEEREKEEERFVQLLVVEPDGGTTTKAARNQS